jgi:hypothetical protein
MPRVLSYMIICGMLSATKQPQSPRFVVYNEDYPGWAEVLLEV